MSRSVRDVRVIYVNFGSNVISVKHNLLRYKLLYSIIESYARLENEPQKGYQEVLLRNCIHCSAVT